MEMAGQVMLNASVITGKCPQKLTELLPALKVGLRLKPGLGMRPWGNVEKHEDVSQTFARAETHRSSDVLDNLGHAPLRLHESDTRKRGGINPLAEYADVGHGVGSIAGGRAHASKSRLAGGGIAPRIQMLDSETKGPRITTGKSRQFILHPPIGKLGGQVLGMLDPIEERDQRRNFDEIASRALGIRDSAGKGKAKGDLAKS